MRKQMKRYGDVAKWECLVSFNNVQPFYTRGLTLRSLNAKQISHVRQRLISMREKAHHVDKLTNENSQEIAVSISCDKNHFGIRNMSLSYLLKKIREKIKEEKSKRIPAMSHISPSKRIVTFQPQQESKWDKIPAVILRNQFLGDIAD